MERPTVEEFRGLSLTEMDMDTAYLLFKDVSDVSDKMYLYTLSDNCFRCPYQLNQEVYPGISIELSTHHPWNFLLKSTNDTELVSQNDVLNTPGLICKAQNVKFGEFGVYELQSNSQVSECKVETLVEPVNELWPLLVTLVILLALAALFHAVKWAVRHRYTRFIEEFFKNVQKALGYEVTNNNNEEKEEKINTKSRIRSLDTFRGITIALMIFVNDGAGGYWFLEHATWNGLQVADLVFPWFLWIMGVCIPMSIKSLEKRKVPTGVAFVQILRRSVVLFLLGFFANTLGWIDLAKLRIPGVLQRFAITYFVVATTGLLFMDCNMKVQADSKLRHVADVITLWPRWIVAVIFLVIHTVLTFALPVPNCPTGYLGPGGLFDDNQHDGVDCIGGAAGYIDRKFFGVSHIYSNPTAKSVYGKNLIGPYDPEGFLGSLTSVVQVFLGYQAGQIILTFKGHKERMVRFVFWAVLNGILGLALNGLTRDEGPIPINKNLWSLSYVFATTATAFLLMAVVYALVDAYNKWDGTPFIYAGMNSIVLYLGHYVAWQMGPFNYISGPMNTHWDNLVESIWSVSAWLIVAYVMYRKKVFITV